jgi:hypothetical protein
MKRLLILGAFLLALPIAGCTVAPTPAATQGPAGPQGQTGQTGHQGDPGRNDDRERRDQAGDHDRQAQTRDQGRQGHDEPCLAGEHRSTDRDTGRVSCVRN